MQFLLPNKGRFVGTYFCLDRKVSIDKVGCPYLLVALFLLQQKELGCHSVRAMKGEVNLKN